MTDTPYEPTRALTKSRRAHRAGRNCYCVTPPEAGLALWAAIAMVSLAFLVWEWWTKQKGEELPRVAHRAYLGSLYRFS